MNACQVHAFVGEHVVSETMGYRSSRESGYRRRDEPSPLIHVGEEQLLQCCPGKRNLVERGVRIAAYEIHGDQVAFCRQANGVVRTTAAMSLGIAEDRLGEFVDVTKGLNAGERNLAGTGHDRVVPIERVGEANARQQIGGPSTARAARLRLTLWLSLTAKTALMSHQIQPR